MYKFFSKVSDGIDVVTKWILFIDMMAITFLTAAGVFFRFILQSPIQWLYELTILLFAWLIFTGVTVAFKKKEHVRIDFLEKGLGKYGKWLTLFINILCIVFLAISVRGGVYIVLNTYERSYHTIPISMGFFYLSFTINMAMSLIHVVYQILENFQNKEGAI